MVEKEINSQLENHKNIFDIMPLKVSDVIIHSGKV